MSLYSHPQKLSLGQLDIWIIIFLQGPIFHFLWSQNLSYWIHFFKLVQEKDMIQISMLLSRCCAFLWISTSSLALIGNIGVCFFCNSSFSIVCQRVCLWPFYLRHGKQKHLLMLLIDCLSESRKSQIKDTQHSSNHWKYLTSNLTLLYLFWH